MIVAISYLHYAISACGEYLSRSFKRLGHDVIKIGPFYSNQMPYGVVGGITVPDSYIDEPNVILPQSNSVPINFVEAQIKKNVDLWLDINAGFWLDGRPKTGRKVTVLTDPHVLRGLYDNVVHQYDKVFCMQTPYMRENEFYLPYGFDSEWCAPIIPPLEKEYDVSLVGNVYEERVKLFSRLHSEGKRTYLKVGVAKEDAREIYNQSIIGLNWSSRLDMTARVFEIMANQIVPIINRVPDLDKFFEEGKHYLGFSNEDEAVAKIDMVLANPDIAKNIARNARNVMLEGKHSWDYRAETIIQESFRV